MKTKKEKILVVDDEKLIRQLICRKLENEGYICLEAVGADDALEKLRNNSIELVILDINMPGKSGIQLLPEINRKHPDTVVIMATAMADAGIAIQCMKKGALDYINKPFNFDELVLSTQRALEMRRLRLIESSEQYKVIFESANDILMVLDKKGIILDTNEKLKEIGGYESHELIGKNIRILATMMTKSSMVTVAKNFIKRTAGINVQPYEVEMYTKGGELLTVEINAVVLRRADRIVGDLVILRNITKRKKAERALKESEKRWQSLVKNIPDTVMIVDRDGTIQSINHSINHMVLGPAIHEIIGRSIFEYIQPEYHDMIRQVNSEVFRNGKPGSYDIKGIGTDGSISWFETRIEPIKDGRRTIASIQITSDITKRKQAESILRESEERYRAVIEDAHDMIQSIRGDGSFIFANPAWLKTLGYTVEDLPSLNMFDIVHPESKSHCQEMFAKVMDGETIHNVQAIFVAKDGRKILVEGNATPRYVGDSIIATQGIFRDVTERKQAEEEINRLYGKVKAFNIELEAKIKERTKELELAVNEAEAADLAKSEFLSGMSHELRTPLTAVIGFSEVLERQYFGKLNEKQMEYVKDILDSGEHLLSLINDVLDLAKIEAGKAELDPSKVIMKELLEHSLIMIKEKASKHAIHLEARISPTLDNLMIIADQRMLKQVMYNLLSNAAKFTPDNGQIIVEATYEAGELIVSVIDNGIGIDIEKQGKIFDEFYQIQGGVRDKTPGSGLGLPLCKRFVEMHGGKIWLESKGKDQGSIFTFSLPIIKKDKPARS